MTDLELFKPQLDIIIAGARDYVTHADQLPPAAFLLRRDRAPLPLPILAGSGQDKDMSASVIGLAAAEYKAEAIFIALEGWSLPPEAAQKHFAAHGRSSIADHPDRITVITFSFESNNGIWMAVCPVTDEGKERTFGEVHLERVQQAEGRFTGLMPISGTQH